MKKLHDLIHSLSQAEKRHITLRLASSKDSSLLSEYYDTMCKQKNYDFELFLEEAGKPSKLTKSNASLLYEIILKDLRYTLEEDNIEIKLRSYLCDIKILVYKGFLDEAESRCMKLISKAENCEEFAIQEEAYKELWNINFKRGTVRSDESAKIQNNIDDASSKAYTLNKLQSLYRKLTAHFYNYFFYSIADRLPEHVLHLFSEADQILINSNKAKFAFLEIKAMEYMLKADEDSHHEIRKEQLILSFEIKENSNLSALLILSNIFTKLKIDRNIKELEAYMHLLDKTFYDFSGKQKDYVLMENYYDIYFANHSFIQLFRSSENKTHNLTELFNFVKKQKLVTNQILLSRIHLGLIELLLIEEDYLEVLEQVEIYFEEFKKNKKSYQYLEVQVLEAIAIYLLNSFDVFLNKIEHIKRQIKMQNILVSNELQTMLEFLHTISRSAIVDKEEFVAKIKHRQTFQLLMYKIIDKLPMSEIREKYFPINDINYEPTNDIFLQKVEKLMSAQNNS